MKHTPLLIIFLFLLASCTSKKETNSRLLKHTPFITVSAAVDTNIRHDSTSIILDSTNIVLDSTQIKLKTKILPYATLPIDSIGTFALKGLLDLTTPDDKNIRAGIYIRMYKDSIIWVSATFLGFEIVRIFATPRTIWVYNKTNGKIEQSDIATFLVQSNLPTISNPFYTIQSFFLGRMLDSHVDSIQNDEKKNCFLLFNTLVERSISTITTMELKNEIYYPTDIQVPKIANYIIQINYKDWNTIKKNQYFPMQRNLVVYDSSNLNRPIMLASLYFSDAKFNQKLSFPFPFPASANTH